MLILGILGMITLFSLNPSAQIAKAYDVQRKRDLVEIKTALDTYYNDHSFYPQMIYFGHEFSDTGSIYMKKLPQDPYPTSKKSGGKYYYNYLADTQSSQWNILFAQLVGKDYKNNTKANEKSCNGIINKICPDSDFFTFYNYCIVSGALDCNNLPSSGPTAYEEQFIPTLTPQPPVTIIPTATPTISLCHYCPVGSFCRHWGSPLPCTHWSGSDCNDGGVGGGDYCDRSCSVPATSCDP
jgi:hypothetical protein